jgi:hypothetical protein
MLTAAPRPNGYGTEGHPLRLPCTTLVIEHGDGEGHDVGDAACPKVDGGISLPPSSSKADSACSREPMPYRAEFAPIYVRVRDSVQPF